MRIVTQTLDSCGFVASSRVTGAPFVAVNTADYVLGNHDFTSADTSSSSAVTNTSFTSVISTNQDPRICYDTGLPEK